MMGKIAVFKKIAAGAVLLGMTSLVMAFEPITDAEMSAMTAQQGIALQMEFRINTDANGQPLTSPALAANPSSFTNCGSLTNFSSTGCRLALNFANRNDNGGEWLVAKNFYGRIVYPLIYVDAVRTPAAATAYENLDRFKDASGVPLLASPHDIPTMQLAFPKEIEIWNLTIGGLSVEYGATGYLNNANAPFAGIKISNSVPNTPAIISAQGTMKIYGF